MRENLSERLESEDPDAGRVVVFNRAAARLTGTATEEAIGKYVFDVLPFRDDDTRDWWMFVDPYHGLPTRTRHPERSLFLADGRECKVITGIDDHSRFCVIATVVLRATAARCARRS